MDQQSSNDFEVHSPENRSARLRDRAVPVRYRSVVAMDLGLDYPEALERLFIVLDEIQRIDKRVRVFFDDPSGIERDENGIAALVADHPDPHVDIRRTMLAALGGMRGSLTNVRTQVTSVPTTPEVLATLCRTALLASCRLLVLVGPPDINDRKRNTVRVML